MINQVVNEDLKFICSSKLPWEHFEGQTVLITGANGFLPAYMVETLLYLNEFYFSDKVNIIALVRSEEKAKRRFINYLASPQFSIVVQDVCEPLVMEGEIDYIIHAASQASPIYYGIDPVGTLSANVLGTMNLLKLAKEKQVKSFLFFSSGEVYGEIDEELIPTKENSFGYIDPLNVRSCYSESKRMGETISVAWLHQYGVPVKIVRPFHTYGPGMNLDDGRVFADFVKNIVDGNDIVMKSDGKNTRAFCYLADATIGFFTVLLKGQNGEAYNIGNDMAEISIIGLANKLVGLFPEKKMNVKREERFDNYLQSKINRNCPDINKVRLLGWEPKYGIEDGFKRTVLSFKDETC